MIKYNIGDWVKIIDEDDFHKIIEINLDGNNVRIEGITGHTWYTGLDNIERRVTKKELGGDEYSHFGDDEEDYISLRDPGDENAISNET